MWVAAASWGALMGILGVPEDGVPRGLASGVNGPYMHTRTSLKKVKCLGCHVLLIIDSESQSRIYIEQKWLSNSLTSCPLQPPPPIQDHYWSFKVSKIWRLKTAQGAYFPGICCWLLLWGRTFRSLSAIACGQHFRLKFLNLFIDHVLKGAPDVCQLLQDRAKHNVCLLGLQVCLLYLQDKSEGRCWGISYTSGLGFCPSWSTGCVAVRRGHESLSSLWKRVVVWLCLVSFWRTLTWRTILLRIIFQDGTAEVIC